MAAKMDVRFPLAHNLLTTLHQILAWFWDLGFLVGFECFHIFRDSFTDLELGLLQELGSQVCIPRWFPVSVLFVEL